MSDKSSAYIFAAVFEMIAKELPSGPRRKTIARRFWKLSGEFDFSDEDMHADKALIALGLATKEVDPKYPEDGLQVVYDR
jgi:hypothetical protein